MHGTSSPLRATATVVKTVTLAAELIMDELGAISALARAIAARWPADGRGGWLALPAMSIAMALTAQARRPGKRQLRGA